MPGALRLLLILSQVAAYDHIQPPQDLQVSVPMLGNVVLSWKHSETPGNRSIKYSIKLTTAEKEDEFRVKVTHYTYPMLALHRGLLVQVAAMIADAQDSAEESKTSEWVSQELPPYSGDEETAATQLSCQINIEPSNKGTLRCIWLPGEKAPVETQYYLYYRHDQVTEKCQDYWTEPGGVRQTGCQILLSHLLINEPKEILVHINGSSRSLRIRGMEKVFRSSNIEVLPPVLQVSYEKMGDRCLRWIKPVQVLPGICFSYEVNIWSDINDTVTVSAPSFCRNALLAPPSKQYLRVRAVGKPPCWYTEPYSPWTEYIGDGEIDVKSTDLLAITVSVCLTVSCIAVFVLCVRFWRILFPQIPTPRNDLKDAFHNTQNQALIRCNSWDNEEVISYIVEMSESDTLSTDYTQIGEYPGSSTYKAA